MAKPASQWIQVAAFRDIPTGEAKGCPAGRWGAASRCSISMDESTPLTTSAPTWAIPLPVVRSATAS